MNSKGDKKKKKHYEGKAIVIIDVGGVRIADMTVEEIKSQGGVAVANYDSMGLIFQEDRVKVLLCVFF